ncbi:MAG: peptidoglycan DD-metalloendopeptidase family protein, partial [Rhodocyclaceae bacterium]|nr:peptidoglycan DD-metalloendopeptidase family protein [Rhodocyclaceae bacterium]
DIAGKAGDSIVAVADGRVIYAGPGVHAFGKLIIIRHTRDYISVYAHASEALIIEGQNVTRGEKIAKLSSSHTSPSKLHFEIHFQGEPVDPQKYLSPR